MGQEPNIEENEEVRQQDPQELARRVALEAAERQEDVGPFLTARDMGENVFDYRFVSDIKGYEGWQWSVTLYHDPELGSWTVDEASLLPTDQSLLAPDWIPWKDRIKPEDLSPTDVLGTQADDPRMEDGLGSGEVSEEEGGQASGQAESQVSDQEEDRAEAVESFMLSRRHVMTDQAREETAHRWYNGPHGPKSLSTQAAEGNVCETCAFFIPLQGQLGSMFGVCANKWSQDDGRVVSLDHGCGGHSEIEPPEPTELWVQSDLRLDDSTGTRTMRWKSSRNRKPKMRTLKTKAKSPRTRPPRRRLGKPPLKRPTIWRRMMRRTRHHQRLKPDGIDDLVTWINGPMSQWSDESMSQWINARWSPCNGRYPAVAG